MFINDNARSILIAHNTSIVKTLFDIPNDKACLVFDATYRLAQKSKNFAGQKQLWSEKKKMPLVKPMVGCAPDGYVLFVLGMMHLIMMQLYYKTVSPENAENAEKLHTIKEDDHILVDKGFRDVLNFLTETKKLNTHWTLDSVNLMRLKQICQDLSPNVVGLLNRFLAA